ncbi:acyl carrier protein [Salegentibacter salarius]|uniref:Acyl carrier protein n=1 Tax=Salegentibacter salarius TaxID=435906 RepID=A0A2N0TMQ3_9FLAO|nr:phosphopantetheine-binding protein [Salegentibacter salarius]OEY71388.1 acyl carrier protein [Salegentibacter salarius]PKD16025.1 acyl carrier protein [Salegentibacter salarius]SLJ91901.1 acyl carrier protein [Salegentibacter salarius]
MKEKEILDSLKKIVTPYVQRKEGLENFNEETDFIKDLEVNSANLVDVILDVEDEFDIEIDNDSMSGMLTVGDAKNIIERKLASA